MSSSGFAQAASAIPQEGNQELHTATPPAYDSYLIDAADFGPGGSRRGIQSSPKNLILTESFKGKSGPLNR